MRRINSIIHLSKQNHFILRVQANQVKNLQVGETVVTKELIKIGRVYDIFGPVEHPFISIKPNPDITDAKNYVGQLVYSFEEKKGENRLKGR